MVALLVHEDPCIHTPCLCLVLPFTALNLSVLCWLQFLQTQNGTADLARNLKFQPISGTSTSHTTGHAPTLPAPKPPESNPEQHQPHQQQQQQHPGSRRLLLVLHGKRIYDEQIRNAIMQLREEGHEVWGILPAALQVLLGRMQFSN